MRNYSIGIFDSGIGGLALLKSIQNILPNEHLIYLADTANFPYGTKNDTEVRGYVQNILQYFVNNWQTKAIVIACNTASVINQQNPYLKESEVMLYDMIVPTVSYVKNNYHNYDNIGIIATPNTINSQVYQKQLSNNFSANIQALPTPLLASAIEGNANLCLSEIIHEYLSNPILNNIQALLLACTHYIWIKKEIKVYYSQKQQKVSLIDPINIVANKLKEDLNKHNLISQQKSKSKADLYLTTSQAPYFRNKIQTIIHKNYDFHLKQISL